MELARLVQKEQSRLYYPKHFRTMASLLWLTLLINIALVPVLIVLYFSQDNPAYYANNFDGLVTPITPILHYHYVAPQLTPAQPNPGT